MTVATSMYHDHWKRNGITTNIYYQVLLTLIVSIVCCHCTEVVAVNDPPALNVSTEEVSNHSSGPVDYKTWQQENIDSKLYLGHGVFLYKSNNTNSSKDWLIKTDDIPKLFHFGFPAANSDTSDNLSDSSSTTSKPVVRSWVLGLACFVGGLLIMVAITVAVLARKWMHRSLNHRRRSHRSDRHHVIVEADPDAPKVTGPSTICGRLPIPLTRHGIQPDDGLPPYTRLESSTGYTSMLDLSQESRNSHSLDVPLPSYSELPTGQAQDIMRNSRYPLQLEDGIQDSRDVNYSNNEGYSHPSERNHLPKTPPYNDPRKLHRQLSSNSNSGIENRFIPDWCEGENFSTVEGRDILGQTPCYYRLEPQEKQQEIIRAIDNLSAAESTSPGNPSNRQLHHFPSSGSASLSHTPVFIPTDDGLHRDEVSNSYQQPKRTQSPLAQVQDREMWSQLFTARKTNIINDIPSNTVLHRVYQNNTTSGDEKLPGSDVTGESPSGAPSAEGSFTQSNMMDCDMLSELREGVFIAE